MPKQGLTEIVCIIDRSGSMGSIREDAEGGFNNFVEQQKKEPGEALITLVQFDTEYEVVWNGINIQDADAYFLIPRGMTALLDAIGKTINTVGERLDKTPEEDRPEQVIVVIVTDGHENSSQEFSRGTINEMITHQREKYNWEFVFLAANQDAMEEATSLGIARGKAVNIDATKKGMVDTYGLVNCAVSSYRSSGSTGQLPGHASNKS